MGARRRAALARRRHRARGLADVPAEYPPTYADVHPGSYDAKARLRYMDEASIWAQVLYPNVGGFGSENFLRIDDAQLKLALRLGVQRLPARVGVGRPAPLAPDHGHAVLGRRRDRRARSSGAPALGHRGILFTGEPQRFGLPFLGDPHWDPLWEVAQDAGLPIHFHIGSGGDTIELVHARALREHGVAGHAGVHGGRAVHEERRAVRRPHHVSGVLPRFPELQFVSVESGIGWIPFVLEAADHSYLEASARTRTSRVGVLPSEYFASRCTSATGSRRSRPRSMLDEIPVDNILFETDFPHPTCLYGNVQEKIEASLADATEEPRRRILWENAERLLAIEAPPATWPAKGEAP